MPFATDYRLAETQGIDPEAILNLPTLVCQSDQAAVALSLELDALLTMHGFGHEIEGMSDAWRQTQASSAQPEVPTQIRTFSLDAGFPGGSTYRVTLTHEDHDLQNVLDAYAALHRTFLAIGYRSNHTAARGRGRN